jgi:iron uptake system component EfeO
VVAVMATVSVLGLLGTACGKDAASGTTVKVTGTDTACTPARTELPAGSTGFEFTNSAGKVNELYVLKEGGEVVAEVENVTTGTSRTLTADLTAGSYKVRCKPGQEGKGLGVSEVGFNGAVQLVHQFR